MKALITANGQLGPFSTVETLIDRYRCDGIEYQFSVIGAATIGDWIAPLPPPPPVPQSVTRFQALAALSNAGLLTSTQNAVNSSTNPLVPLAWNNAQSFDRTSPTIASIAGMIGLTSAQIDSLFIAAAQIKA